MHAAATLGTRAVAGARGHARMRKSEPVNVTKKFFRARTDIAQTHHAGLTYHRGRNTKWHAQNVYTSSVRAD